MALRTTLALEFMDKYVRPLQGATLITGSKVYKTRHDRRQNYLNALGVDMLPGEGVDLVWNLEQRLPLSAGLFKHAECWSVLEHCKRPWLVANTVEQALVQGGTLHLTVPFVWRIHGFPDDYWRFTTSAIKELFPNIKWKALLYAHHTLSEEVPGGKVKGHKYFPKCEVFGFGYRI